MPDPSKVTGSAHEASSTEEQNTVRAGWGICPHYRKGYCRYGDACRYEHVPRTANQPFTPVQDQETRHRHDSQSKTHGVVSTGWGVCPHLRRGFCKFGKDCRYEHDIETSNGHKPVDDSVEDKGVATNSWGVCPHFQKGFCKYSDQCRYQHVPAERGNEHAFSDEKSGKGGVKKVQVCPHYARGYCKRGSQCGFIHEAQPSSEEYTVQAACVKRSLHKPLSLATRQRLYDVGLLDVCFESVMGTCSHSVCKYSHRTLKPWEIRFLKNLLDEPVDVQSPSGQQSTSPNPLAWQTVKPQVDNLATIIQQQAEEVVPPTVRLEASRPDPSFRRGRKLQILGSTILRRKLGDNGTSRVALPGKPESCRSLDAQPCVYARSSHGSLSSKTTTWYKARRLPCQGGLPVSSSGSRFPTSSYVANPPGTKVKVAVPTTAPSAGGSQTQWPRMHQSVFQRLQWADVADTSDEELDGPADQSSISVQPLNAGDDKKVVDRSTRRKLKKLKNDAFWKLRRTKPLSFEGRVEAPRLRDNTVTSRNVLVDPQSAQVHRCVLDSLWSKLASREVLTPAQGTGQPDGVPMDNSNAVVCGKAWSNQSLPSLTANGSTGCLHPGEPGPIHGGPPDSFAEDRTSCQINLNPQPTHPSQAPRFVLNSLWSKLAHEGTTTLVQSACKSECPQTGEQDPVCRGSPDSVAEHKTVLQVNPNSLPTPSSRVPRLVLNSLWSKLAPAGRSASTVSASKPGCPQTGEHDLARSEAGTPDSLSFHQRSVVVSESRVILDSVWSRRASQGTAKSAPSARQRGRSPPGEPNLVSGAKEEPSDASRSSCQGSFAVPFACYRDDVSASNEHCLGGDHLIEKMKKRTSSQNPAQKVSLNPSDKRDKTLAGTLVEALDLREPIHGLKVPKKIQVKMDFDKTMGFPGEGPPKKSSTDQGEGWGACPHFQRGFCKFGKDCRYVHSSREEIPARSPQGSDTALSSCPHFRKGFCKYGDQCRYEHSPKARSSSASAKRAAGESHETRDQQKRAAIQAAKEFVRARRAKEKSAMDGHMRKALGTSPTAVRSRSPLRKPPPPPKSNRVESSGQRSTPPPPPRARSRSVVSGPEGSGINKPKLSHGPQPPPTHGKEQSAGSGGIVKPKFEVKISQSVPKVPPQIVQPKINLEFNYSVAQKGMSLKRGSVDLPSVLPDQPLNISGKLVRQRPGHHHGEGETTVLPLKESLASMPVKVEDPPSTSSVPEASSSHASNLGVSSDPVNGQEGADGGSGASDRPWMSHEEVQDLEHERLKKEEQQQEEDLQVLTEARVIPKVVAAEGISKPEALNLGVEPSNVRPAASSVNSKGRPEPSDSYHHQEPASAAVSPAVSANTAEASRPIQREGYRARLKLSEDPDDAAYRIITIKGERETPIRVHCTRRILECVLLVWRSGFRLDRLMRHLPSPENRLISFPPVMKEQLSHVIPGSELEIVFEPDPEGCQAEVDHSLLKCLLERSQYTERSCQHCDPTRPMKLFQEKRPSGRGLVLTPDLRLRSFATGVPGKDVLQELHQEGYHLRGLCKTKGHWMTVPLELRIQPRGFLLVWPVPIQD